MDVSALTYHKFFQFALEEAQRRTSLVPLPAQSGASSPGSGSSVANSRNEERSEEKLEHCSSNRDLEISSDLGGLQAKENYWFTTGNYGTTNSRFGFSKDDDPSGYFFNPRFMYGADAHVDGEVLQGTLKVIGRLSRNPEKRLEAEVEDRFKSIRARDNKTELHSLSFHAPKIRCLRSLNISGGKMMQVLDFAIFAEAEFDLPIFCANFFTSPSLSIIVLDLNPLHDVITQNNYKDKYYRKLLPLGQKYAELLPWGDKITSESLKFFSPIVIWSKFTPCPSMHEILYSAFMDYFKAWLDLMEQSVEEKDALQILLNREAQHRYLTWRAEKDPGYPLLKKLMGESFAKDLVENFLFNGVNFLGTKTFLDYFPEYGSQDGTISQRRSIVGKSFESRPWDEKGNFICAELG